MKYHVGRPNIGSRSDLHRYLDEILDSRWLTNGGQFVERFEEGIKHVTGVKHAVAVCNATTGLQVLAKCLDLSEEVIMPSHTFISTPHAFSWIGLKPVFCEVDPETHNIDPNRLKSLISDNTSAIVGVHLWGRPAPIAQLEQIAESRHLQLIFDAAHAFGCTRNGKHIGNFGDAEVFSFHATKFVNSFEGGVVVTNDDGLAGKLRLVRNYGFIDDGNLIGNGTNAKLSEIHAAMGVVSLEMMSRIMEWNVSCHFLIRESLKEVGVKIVEYDEEEQNNFQYFIVEVDNRDERMRQLQEMNVLAKRYFWPGCHRMSPYLLEDIVLPITEELQERVLVIPLGIANSDKLLKAVTEVLA